MIPLASHQRMWTYFCVYPPEENTSGWKKLVFMIFTFTIFMGNFTPCLGSIAFAQKYVATDLEGGLHALFQLSAYFSMAYVIIIEILSKREIAALFFKLRDIYQKRKSEFKSSNQITNIQVRFEFFSDSTLDENDDTYVFLVRADERSEWMWPFYLKFALFSFINAIFSAASSVFVCWRATGGFDEKLLYHPFRLM